MPSSAAELVELLDIETLDTDLFRGQQPRHRPAARLRRAGRRPGADRRRSGPSSEGLEVHSMHAYFLRPGDTTIPIIYDAERIRDGRSFETRRVVARQHGHPIFYLTANFQRPEEGFEHQDAMPEVPAPDEGLTFAQIAELRTGDDEAARRVRQGVGRARHPLPRQLGAPGAHPPRRGHRPARARAALDPGQRRPRRRPRAAHRGVHLRQRPDPARRDPGAARRRDRLPEADAGLARPHDLVPPAVPGRPVVALRPVVAVGAGRVAASRSRGSSPRTAAWSRRSPRRD